ncbi:MAG: hypothetical protein Q9181_007903 [Wetmoreana brouardii]
MPAYNLQNPSTSQSRLPDPLPPTFILRTPSGRDIWRKPPSTDRFDAPLLLRALPLSSFRCARVTVSAQWHTQYDQGGLVLILPSKTDKERRWIKTGVEHFENRANISTVACDRWADWSLVPLREESLGKVTVEMTREVRKDEKTSTLWVHSVDTSTGEKKALREITWVFEDENMQGDQECEVGVYAAKPNPDESDPGKELDVTFENLTVDTW